MIGVAQRFALRPLLAPSLILRRRFSIKAIYSSFPTTLSYYSPRPKLCLYDESEADDHPDDVWDDRVMLENGIVFPRATQNPSVSNGAVMFPNTVLMQQLFRRNYDDALDREEAGSKIETPYVFSFSLQPAHGMPLEVLNEALNDFYSLYARKEKADTWLDNHPYHLAIDDYNDEKWMSKQ
ncbi:hypothetical protein F5B22DRAFT_643862 [Xylaria bambusicola]|uniref:uncharacterized protein n=1 Tax=Xylaria bambusicola TaxID=326684 RepID=UPI00200864E2|nr:uncharacterized protein F5B22DRAFT_643862 [Xylaria bambusicola]KAI0521691.1 hypothetical protein F5B22DRAFT_643862 [Xylaria bambusicola]